MDILYTLEEKYLQAIEELNYGELPKALHLFHEIVSINPEYARAYYQLGYLYHYQFKDFRTAGYYYIQCISLEPEFPDVYEHYLRILIILNMHQKILKIANQALSIVGVNTAEIYETLGLYAEREQDYLSAKNYYKKAVFATCCESKYTVVQDHLKRIEGKQNKNRNFVYVYQS